MFKNHGYNYFIFMIPQNYNSLHEYMFARGEKYIHEGTNKMGAWFVMLCVVGFFGFFIGCMPQGGINEALYKGRELYTRVNLRYDERRSTGSYIGYTKLKLLPANSRVRILKLRSNGFLMEIPSGKVINVRYREEWGAPEHKPIEEIMPLLFSETDISMELDLFSVNDKKNIKHGVPSVGMSKRAVIVALGYPAAHMTTSIEDDIWTYWRNRFLQFYIRFENGKVSEISRFKPRRTDG